MTDTQRVEVALRRALAATEANKNAWLALEILLQEIILINVSDMRPISEDPDAH